MRAPRKFSGSSSRVRFLGSERGAAHGKQIMDTCVRLERAGGVRVVHESRPARPRRPLLFSDDRRNGGSPHPFGVEAVSRLGKGTDLVRAGVEVRVHVPRAIGVGIVIPRTVYSPLSPPRLRWREPACCTWRNGGDRSRIPAISPTSTRACSTAARPTP